MDTDKFFIARILWSSGLEAGLTAGGLCLGWGGVGGSSTLVTVIAVPTIPGNTGGCGILCVFGLDFVPGVAGFLFA